MDTDRLEKNFKNFNKALGIIAKIGGFLFIGSIFLIFLRTNLRSIIAYPWVFYFFGGIAASLIAFYIILYIYYNYIQPKLPERN